MFRVLVFSMQREWYRVVTGRIRCYRLKVREGHILESLFIDNLCDLARRRIGELLSEMVQYMLFELMKIAIIIVVINSSLFIVFVRVMN